MIASEDGPLSVAVIGAGMMGSNHARVVTGSPVATLFAVVDEDPERRAAAAERAGAATMGSVDELLDGDELPDAVVVATPTVSHAPIASRLLRAGIPVLVEKPLAASIDEAEELAALARAEGVPLAVGHVERFNPVVRELLGFPGTVRHVEAHRIGPFAARIPDSVVSDLMIHDLDIVRAIAGGALVDVSGVAQSQRTDTEDLATAILRFDTGVTAAVTASRLGQQKIRQIQLTTDDAYVVGDLLRQDVTVTRVQHTEYVSDDGSRYRQTAAVEIPFLDNRGEPLAAQLESFLHAVRTGAAPEADADDGVEAMRMVGAVLAAIR